MSIADLSPAASKILVLDIERMKGQATVEFWDLGDFKNRRIHADDVTLWPRTICVAWQWLGESKVHFAAEWDTGHRGDMLEQVWKAYDEAAIVVGHNLQGFDTKKLESEWWLMGLPTPSPYKTVDTLKVARSTMGMESNTLDAICKRAGIVSKTDRYDVEVARAACAGDKKAQKQIKAYNVGDIHATTALYLSLRGRIPGHPHIGEINVEERRCNQCGSGNLQRNGVTRAVVIDYVLYRCGDCGANVKGTKHSRQAATRGAR
jgi:hypothetical protein